MNKLAQPTNGPVRRQPDFMLNGRTIAVTAERRAHQQIRYFESRNADVRWAPVLRTIDGATRAGTDAATTRIVEEGIDLLIVQTGQVLNWWLDRVAAPQQPLLGEELGKAEIFTRGSKATSAVRRRGYDVAWQAPGETVSDIVARLQSMDLSNVRCAVLLDGNDDRQVVETARDRGASVIELDVYRYTVPVDRGPIDALIADIVAERIDVVTFTASPAIRHLRSLAAEGGTLDALDAAMKTHCKPAVVGPVCAATAVEAGWCHLIEPSTARLIPMLDAIVAELALG